MCLKIIQLCAQRPPLTASVRFRFHCLMLSWLCSFAQQTSQKMSYTQSELKDKVVHMIACLNEYKTNCRRLATLLAQETNSAHKAGYYAGYTMSMDLVDETTKKLTELLLNFMDQAVAVEKIFEVGCHFLQLKNFVIICIPKKYTALCAAL